MKIATYHRNRGDIVEFFKGEAPYQNDTSRGFKTGLQEVSKSDGSYTEKNYTEISYTNLPINHAEMGWIDRDSCYKEVKKKFNNPKGEKFLIDCCPLNASQVGTYCS